MTPIDGEAASGQTDKALPVPHANFRAGPFAKDQGAYEQLIKILRPQIDPGDTVEAHHYFVGYGEIQAAKVCCWPSGELFDVKNSEVEHGLGYSKAGPHGAVTPYWGKQSNRPGFSSGIVISLAGVGVGPQQSSGTAFVDETWPQPQGFAVPRLWTEINLGGKPPVRYVLKTKKDIKPGKYFIEFNFTYHDGKGWKTTTKKAEFHVRNFLERYAVQLGLLGSSAAVVAIAKSFGLLDYLLKGLQI